MALVVIIGTGALFALAVARFGRRCCHGCETSAISTLRRISSAEFQARACAVIDVDGDGVGEFGGFRELSGALALRGRDAPLDPSDFLNPPVLSGAFRTTRGAGSVHRAGFAFRLYLRTANGAWVSPDVSPDVVDADAAETGFLCYAWALHACDSHAHRTFVVDETGTILATSDLRYPKSSGPRPDAAPSAGHGLAAGIGADGGAWKRVN